MHHFLLYGKNLPYLSSFTRYAQLKCTLPLPQEWVHIKGKMIIESPYMAPDFKATVMNFRSHHFQDIGCRGVHDIPFELVKIKYKYINRKSISWHDFLFEGNSNVFPVTIARYLQSKYVRPLPWPLESAKVNVICHSKAHSNDHGNEHI